MLSFFHHGKLLKILRFYVPIKCQRSIGLKKYFFFATKPVESQRSLSMTNQLKPEVILSEKNRTNCIERLKLQQKTINPKGNVSQSRAAVLVPLCVHNGELGLLYTLRSTKLNSNRGEVSFPGGMRDKKDNSFEETAIRETWEELRIPREKVDVWSSATPIGRKNMSVVPVLSYIGDVEPEKMDINRDEVEEAFVLSLKCLCEPSSCRFTQFRDQYTLPVFLAGRYRIWGLTAAITHMVMRALVPETYKHRLVYLSSIDHTASPLSSTIEDI